MLLVEMDANNGFIGYHNHVYLLESFFDPITNLIDPSDNHLFKSELPELMKNMEEGKGFFGLIKKLN